MSVRSRFAVFACAVLVAFGAGFDAAAQSAGAAVAAFGETINAQLESSGAGYRLDYAEFLTSPDSGEAANTVFFNNRGNKQLGAHYVPGDPRRGGATNITYTIDQAEGTVDGLTQAQTNAAIGRAMTTWDNVSCSAIPINQVGNPGGDIGVIEFLNGLGGSPFVYADLQHAGWVPAGVFPPSVIAVTFTFAFTSGPGVFTDIDNNNRADVAFREILYHDAFTWKINGNIDVETVALHEAGHGLSQAHFGTGFISGSGKLQYAPRAVMNAAYSGLQQTIDQTDEGGHCSIWASWPNN